MKEKSYWTKADMIVSPFYRIATKEGGKRNPTSTCILIFAILQYARNYILFLLLSETKMRYSDNVCTRMCVHFGFLSILFHSIFRLLFFFCGSKYMHENYNNGIWNPIREIQWQKYSGSGVGRQLNDDNNNDDDERR